MIDLRCHLLDGSVGGPKDFAESVEMCKQAAREGVRTVVVTERWDAEMDEPPQPFSVREQKLARLQGEMGGALTFKPGFVLRFRPGLPALVEQFNSSITLGGGRYVLVALPALRAPAETEDVWERLLHLGISPLVAGPECSPDLRRNRQRLERWLESGVKLQLNAASVTGAHGREAQRFALHCVKEYQGRVVVASNAREAGARRPSLSAAREMLARQLGKRRVQSIFDEMPAEILETSTTDANLRPPQPRGASSLLQLLKLKKAVTDAS